MRNIRIISKLLKNILILLLIILFFYSIKQKFITYYFFLLNNYFLSGSHTPLRPNPPPNEPTIPTKLNARPMRMHEYVVSFSLILWMDWIIIYPKRFFLLSPNIFLLGPKTSFCTSLLLLTAWVVCYLGIQCIKILT
jgi:hypothetical protein